MLDHQGRKTFSHDETVEVFAELARLADVIDATAFVASGAILHSDDIGWAWNHAATFMRSAMGKYDVSTQGRLLKWYAPLYNAKISVDILDPLRDLSAYKVVFVPNLYLITPDIVENLKHYIRSGGLLIMGPKAALKDWDSVFYSDLPPCGGLAEVFGTTVKPTTFSWFARGDAPVKRIAVSEAAPFAGGMSFVNEGLFDYLEPAGAQALALHENGDAAITAKQYGRGLAIYMGCEPEAAFYRYCVEWLVSIGKLEPVLKTDADVEVTMRVGGGHKLIFVLNHNAAPVQISLAKEYRELISGQPVSGILMVEGQGVRILSEEMRQATKSSATGLNG